MPNLNILALETCDHVRQDVRLTTGSAVYVQSDVLMLPALKTNATAEEAEVFVSALTRTLESMRNYTGVTTNSQEARDFSRREECARQLLRRGFSKCGA